MLLFEILLIIAIASIIALFLFYVLKISGPWGSFWSILLILVFAGLAAAKWIAPRGPEFQDVAWLPTVFIIVFFALLIAAATPASNKYSSYVSEEEAEQKPPGAEVKKTGAYAVMGVFFYLMMIFLLVSIFYGFLGNR